MTGKGYIMNDNAVVFKGTKEGLYIILKEELDVSVIKNHLDKKIRPSKRFFEGAKIVNFKGKRLSREEFDELKGIIEQDYGMTFTGSYNELSFASKHDREEHSDTGILEQLPYEHVQKGEALVVRATVRSGQLIDYKGNIVIIGDVNPGAHIKAAGSIIVMGSMRGIAHAGVNGDYSAFIVAFKIQPMQLRIGDIITRAPDSISPKISNPEIALVKQGMIVVEPYLPNK